MRIGCKRLPGHGSRLQVTSLPNQTQTTDRTYDQPQDNETTPTFDINGTMIVDFDQVRLRAALGAK